MPPDPQRELMTLPYPLVGGKGGYPSHFLHMHPYLSISDLSVPSNLWTVVAPVIKSEKHTHESSME